MVRRPAGLVRANAEAQRVVVRDDVAERLLEDVDVELARHLEEERLVPVVRVGEALLEEPALDRGRRTGAGGPRCSACVARAGAVATTSASCGDGRVLEQVARRELQALPGGSAR